MLQLISTLLMQARPAGADPSIPRLVDLDPVLVGGPSFRRLFLDAMVVEESHGLERCFHAAEKYEGNPVFVKERDWEGWGPLCGGTVIRDGDKLRMYYYCIADDEKTKCCVAESEDGLHWTRPIVGDVEWRGSKENNIITGGTQVIKFAHPESPDRTWVSFHNTGLQFSADGLHWSEKEPNDGSELFSSSDVQNYFYDPYNNRIACTWKCSSRRHRSCGIVWTEDLKTWVKPVNGPVFTADDLDPDATQIYGMPVFAYQGMYIGIPAIYHARWIKYGRYTSPQVMYEAQEGSPRTIDAQIAWTWDFINWTRTPKREPFIANSPFHAYDSGMLLVARAPVVMGDELWFYYSAADQIHEDYKGITCSVALAKLRIDGFCSMRAGEDEGWFISRREVFNTPKVYINAKCKPGGYVAAELLDRHNNVIPGFEWYYSNAFTGDSTCAELTWKTQKFPDSLIDKDKKIKFRIRNADLFSYLPADINTEIDDGWPD
jgi:hypothetical protein